MITIKKNSILNKILICLSPVIIVFLTEYINFGSLKDTTSFVARSSKVVVFDILLVTFLLALGMLLVRKFWISFMLVGGISIGFSISSIIKFTMNDDPFYPWDLAMIKSLGTITSFGTNFYTITRAMIISVLIFIGMIIAFGFMKFELKMGYRNIVYFAGGVLALSLFFTSDITKKNIMPFFGLNKFDTLKQDISYYQDNGFIGAFSLNIAHCRVEPMGRYDADTMNVILDKYKFSESDINNLKNKDDLPNVIVILSESFWDARKLNVEYSSDMLQNFDKASKKGYKGEMISPVFGGGTIRSEFEVLTGLQSKTLLSGCSPYVQYVKSPTLTLASYFKSLGYDTTAVHTFQKKFFNRHKGLPLMGFDNFIALEDIEKRSDFEKKGYYTSDDFFVKLLIEQLEKKSDKPKFIFGISMQNHQGYAKDKYEKFDKDIEVLSDIGTENKEILESYVQGVYDADKSLGKLLSYLEKLDKETVVLFFGDHLPTLGPNNKVYVDTGFIESEKNWSAEESKKMFSTPYLVWSNKKNLNNSQNKGNTVGAYYLGEELLEACDIPKYSVYKFLEKNKNISHGYNGYLFIDGNNYPHKKFNDKEEKAAFNEHNLITFDLIIGEKYFSEIQK